MCNIMKTIYSWPNLLTLYIVLCFGPSQTLCFSPLLIKFALQNHTSQFSPRNVLYVACFCTKSQEIKKNLYNIVVFCSCVLILTQNLTFFLTVISLYMLIQKTPWD